MLSESIIVSIIGALGTIIAAYVGAGYVSKTINKTAEAYFFNYSEKGRDLHDVLKKAKNSIVIIANCGDNLLHEYSKKLRTYMKNGVSIKFLLIDYSHFTIMDNYTAQRNDHTPLEASIKELKTLKAEYPSSLNIRVFDSILTSSYIGVDLEKDPISNSWPKNSILQIMPYHYHVTPKDSPITFLTPKDHVHFGCIVNCVEDIWNNSKTVEDLESIISHAQCN